MISELLCVFNFLGILALTFSSGFVVNLNCVRLGFDN